MEHEAEFEKLARRGTDYDELLQSGRVARHKVEDAEEWRSTIRAKARADRIKVRTGVSAHDPTIVWATLRHVEARRPAEEQWGEWAGYEKAIGEAFERARARGHAVFVIRAREQRAAAQCTECGARLYLDWSVDPSFMEGEVFETDCTGKLWPYLVPNLVPT